MLLNTQETFSDAQAVTSTAISTNVIDLNPVDGPNDRQDIGQGEDIYLVVRTETAATDTGSDATLAVTLETADNAALSTNAEVVFSTGALAFADFSPAGTTLAIVKLPTRLYRKYLGLRYTVASGPLTAGKFDAFLVKDADVQRYYASGFSV